MSGAPDLRAVAEAYVGALRDFLAVAEQVRTDEWALPTDCPGWTVHDQVAHVLDVESRLAGDERPDHEPDWAALPHVRNDAGRFMEVGVDALREVPGPHLVERLRPLVAKRVPAIRASAVDPQAMGVGVLGNPVPLARSLPLRVFDVWAHEQDVRRAVGRPGNLASEAARQSRDTIVGALPYVVGKAVAPPPGTSVRFLVSGELPLDVAVAVGEDGRGLAVDPEDVDATVTLAMAWETLERLACGRVDPATSDVRVEGDLGLARQVLGALAITP